MKSAAALCICCALVTACAAQEAAMTKGKWAAMEKTRNAAKANLGKHPQNASLKARFVQLNDQFAYATMQAEFLTPHEKYSSALRYYRYSLKVNPNDAEAKKWVTTIESIYKSMHRPIPK